MPGLMRIGKLAVGSENNITGINLMLELICNYLDTLRLINYCDYPKIQTSCFHDLLICQKFLTESKANVVDPDQTEQSFQDLQCFLKQFCLNILGNYGSLEKPFTWQLPDFLCLQ